MTARRAGWCWTWIRPTPLHGQRGRRFFHGYYDSYLYLPLYVFCGRHLLCAKLRRKAPPPQPFLSTSSKQPHAKSPPRGHTSSRFDNAQQTKSPCFTTPLPLMR